MTTLKRYTVEKLSSSGQMFINDSKRGYSIAVMLRNPYVSDREIEDNAFKIVQALNERTPA